MRLLSRLGAAPVCAGLLLLSACDDDLVTPAPVPALPDPAGTKAPPPPEALTVPLPADPPREAPAIRHRVTLSIDATSFRGAPPDLRTALEERLRDAGVAVADASEEAEAAVAARVQEKRGDDFRIDPDERTSEPGSALSLELTVKAAKRSPATWVVTASTPLGTEPKPETLAAAALDELEKSPSFARAGDFVGAALGDVESIHALLPLLAHKDAAGQAMAFLKSARFQPKTKVEQCWYAVARRRYRECVKSGAEGVPPLVTVLEGLKSFDVPDLREVSAALANIGTREAEAALLAKLQRFPPQISDPAFEIEPPTAIVTALGKLGGARSAARLLPYSTDARRPVMAATSKAMGEIVKRLRAEVGPPGEAAGRKVQLVVFAEGWRGERFDIEKLVRRKLAAHGATVVDSGPGVDDVVVVDHREQRVGESGVTRTRIVSKLSVVDFREGRVLGPARLEGETPQVVMPDEDPYRLAIAQLVQESDSGVLDAFLDDALGSPQAVPEAGPVARP